MADIFDQVEKESTAKRDIFDEVESESISDGDNRESYTWGETAKSAAVNLVPSTVREIGNIASGLWEAAKTVASPNKSLLYDSYKVLKGLGDIAEGVDSKEAKMAQPLWDTYSERYRGLKEGNFDNLKRTIAEEPASFLNDVSAILYPQAVGAKSAGATKIAKAAETAADVINPVMTAAKAPALLSRGAKSAGVAIQKHTIRSAKLEPGEAAKVATDALERGIGVNEKSLKIIGKAKKDLGRDYEAAFNYSTNANGKIDGTKVIKYLEEQKAKHVATGSMESSKYSAAYDEMIEATKARFDKDGFITPRQAQTMKTTDTSEVNPKVFDKNADEKVREAPKLDRATKLREMLNENFADGLYMNKETGTVMPADVVRNHFPDGNIPPQFEYRTMEQLNKEFGDLAEVEKVFEKVITSNRSKPTFNALTKLTGLLGFGGDLAIPGAGAAAGKAAAAMAVLGNPKFQALLAKAFYKTGKGIEKADTALKSAKGKEVTRTVGKSSIPAKSLGLLYELAQENK